MLKRFTLILLCLCSSACAIHGQAGEPTLAEPAPSDNDLRYQQCQKAFRHEDVAYVLRECPDEAWSLARAQCERNLDGIAPRYYELCRKFGRPVPQ